MPHVPPASRWALVAAVLGSSMAFLDGTFVAVALPVMQTELSADPAQAQWIVEAYLLLLSSLVLVGGALGDRFGRRRVFLAGTVLFALASVGCGLSPTALPLIAARAVQGVGAALLVPGSLSLISAAYPEESQRGAAIGTWSAASAIMSAAGPVAGGWVVTNASWRWLFFVNVPLAAAVVLVAGRWVRETRDEQARGRLDLQGAALVTVALGAVVYALVDAGRRGGLGHPILIACLIAGLVLLVLFVLHERRAAQPMVPLALFRSRTFSGVNLLTLLLYGALGGGLYFLPFDLIQVQGYTPTEAGAALLPLVALISVLSPFAGAFAARAGMRLPLIAGPLVAALGFVLLGVPTVGDSYAMTFLPGVTVLGLGMGVTVAPLTTAVMGAVDSRHAGLASGINNALARAAGLLAVAALGVVLASRFDSALDERAFGLKLDGHSARVLAEQRAQLGAADFSAIAEPGLRASLGATVKAAYAAAFRSVMFGCGLLAASGALAAAVFVPKRERASR